jgi:protein-disulfide isomerase
MRKAILATACVALVAGGVALGITQGDTIKNLFNSKEIYKNREAREQTTPSTQAQINEQGASDDATAAETSASEEASGGMTPVDLSNTPLNEQMPAAGDVASQTTDTTPQTVIVPEGAVPEGGVVPTETKHVVDVAKSLEDRTVGDASAPLTVHDFSSLTCPHCAFFHKEVYPKVKANYIDKGKVRWVFHSFPLNEAALKGDMIARCAPNDQYLKLSDFMFANQERWAFGQDSLANLNMLLKIAGVTDDVFYACVNNKELEAGLVKSAQESAEKYDIKSTPSFVFNDGLKVFSGAGTYEGFAYDLDKALEELGVKKTHTPSVVPEIKKD